MDDAYDTLSTDKLSITQDHAQQDYSFNTCLSYSCENSKKSMEENKFVFNADTNICHSANYLPEQVSHDM